MDKYHLNTFLLLCISKSNLFFFIATRPGSLQITMQSSQQPGLSAGTIITKETKKLNNRALLRPCQGKFRQDMAQKVATARKMKLRQETTSLGQIATVTAKPTISDKHL